MNRYCEECGCEVDGLYGYATCDDCHESTPPTQDELIAIAVHELEKKYLKRDEKRRAA